MSGRPWVQTSARSAPRDGEIGEAADAAFVTVKTDSTRALKTRQLRRLTKRVATPTEFSNEEIYKNSRSNLDERF